MRAWIEMFAGSLRGGDRELDAEPDLVLMLFVVAHTERSCAGSRRRSRSTDRRSACSIPTSCDQAHWRTCLVPVNTARVLVTTNSPWSIARGAMPTGRGIVGWLDERRALDAEIHALVGGRLQVQAGDGRRFDAPKCLRVFAGNDEALRAERPPLWRLHSRRDPCVYSSRALSTTGGRGFVGFAVERPMMRVRRGRSQIRSGPSALRVSREVRVSGCGVGFETLTEPV